MTANRKHPGEEPVTDLPEQPARAPQDEAVRGGFVINWSQSEITDGTSNTRLGPLDLRQGSLGGPDT